MTHPTATADRRLVKVIVEWAGTTEVIIDAPADASLGEVKTAVEDQAVDLELQPVVHFTAVDTDHPGHAALIDRFDGGELTHQMTIEEWQAWRARLDRRAEDGEPPPAPPIAGQQDIFGGEVT